MKGLILAGGSGTRLRPLTYTGPKQLLPIANRPIIYYAIEDLVEAGIREIGIVLGNNLPEMIQQAVGDGSQFGARITYIHQGEPKGIAHAILVSEEFLKKEPFVVYLGDNLLKEGIQEFVKGFDQSDEEARILLCRVKNPEQFGVAELRDDGQVVSLEEKPKNPKSDLALVGIYLFKSSIFQAAKEIRPSQRNELEITDAIQRLIDTKQRMTASIVNGWWKDTGRPEDILEANRLILDDLKASHQGKVEEGVEIQGEVSIGRGTVIREGSVLRGPVIIGKDCEIGPCTYIGPYTSVGDRTVIRGGEVEASIIIGDTRIECGERIVDSLIGRSTEILSSPHALPKGRRLIVGAYSFLRI
jgi:glucose-1-phosphate thymidylyltransferase